MEQTTDYAIALDPDFANFYPAVPYPGTATPAGSGVHERGLRGPHVLLEPFVARVSLGHEAGGIEQHPRLSVAQQAGGRGVRRRFARAPATRVSGDSVRAVKIRSASARPMQKGDGAYRGG